jgi:predicted DNA-binding transcriptional regulator YafY
MRRADRLFLLIQALRRERQVTAEELAVELEVSPRTIYRDVQDLVRSGVPIQGEAGIGYVLREGFDLPPLMFSAEEVEALVLGARLVERFADAGLARAARGALAKAESVLPPEVRQRLEDAPYFAPAPYGAARSAPFMQELRAAIDARRCVSIRYADEQGRITERVIQPLGLFFWGRVWTLAAWCRMREDFRNFRLDRISELQPTDDHFSDDTGRGLADFLRLAGCDD